MTKHEKNAAQHAEPEQVRLRLSELNTIDKTEYERDEDGVYKNRPNLNVCVTLSHETEDYVRVFKTLAGVRPTMLRALRGTYGESEGTRRYNDLMPHLNTLIAELSKDMGFMVTDCLCNWGEDYL